MMHFFSHIKFPLLGFLVALAALMVSQVVFGVVNGSLFDVPDLSAWLGILVGNLHFGLSAVAVYLLPFLVMAVLWRCVGVPWLRVAALWLYGVGVSLMLAVNVIDTPYFQYTFRRLSSDIFVYLSQGFSGEGGLLVGGLFLQFWPYMLYFVVLDALSIYAVVSLSRRCRMHLLNQKHGKRAAITHTALSLVLCLALDLLLVRGGLFSQHKPLAAADASRYAAPENTALVVNSPFSLYRTLGHSSLRPMCYFPEQELDAIYTPVSQPASVLADSSLVLSVARPNVVLIILESFSEEYIGALNGGLESYTPFLDSLYTQSLSFRGLANGKRSIESLPAMFAGIPSLMDGAYITSPFSMNRVDALPSKLQRHGYSTAMFHGAYNGSMNFDSYARMSGIASYYGMDQYDGPRSDYDGTWGIFDEPFLQYSLCQMDTMRAPFFAAVYTISSHNPYTIPEQHKGRFKKGPIPLLETVGYADYALGRFFAQARKRDWFDSTLFIITADHAAQPLSDAYRHGLALYSVPMLFYMPSQLPPSHRARMFQHTDLMPTLLDMMGLGESCCCFGCSALRGDEPFHVVYSADRWTLTRANGSRASLAGNTMESTDDTTATLLRAMLQQYSNRMLQNRLMP
ncbi:MAG: sulfatase-like hydrolase/transferase [Bacteroidales bacterium]|nr:sulfatase-like hydrolase/transferase [Bacteroidales bacterium]